MKTFALVLLCIFSALVFLFLVFWGICELLLSISLKRKSLVGKIVERETKKYNNLYRVDHNWWNKFTLEKETVFTNDGLKLYPRILYQEKKTGKVMVIIHGYCASYLDMNLYAELFYNMGYNLVMAQNRSHGDSEGKMIGMGYLDRLDMLNVLDMVVQKFGKNCEIDIFGLSMGATTVCMLSGEKLPPNVKHLISDCAFASVYDEFRYAYEHNTHLPARGLVAILNLYARFRCGYSIKQADATQFVKNCKVPILFVHGDRDGFVPFENMNKLYSAAPENLRFKHAFKDAGHGESLPKHTEEYAELMKNFLSDNFDKLSKKE